MLTINMAEALAGLNMLAELNMSPWLAAVGAHEVAAIEKRIESTKGSPDYDAWAPWSPRRLRERESKGNVGQGLLWDTGHLLHSFKFESSPFELMIGTDVGYAKELQEGRESPTRMPGRPFVGWSDEQLGAALFGASENIEASAAAYIRKLIGQ